MLILFLQSVTSLNVQMAATTQNSEASSGTVPNISNVLLRSTNQETCDHHRHMISHETVECMGCKNVFYDTWRMHPMPCGICFLCPTCLPRAAVQPSYRMTKPDVSNSVKSLMAASRALRNQALDSGSRSAEQRRALMASANEIEVIGRSEAGLTCRCGVDMQLAKTFKSCLREQDAQLYWSVEHSTKILAT